jgi:hypothetical protein
MISYVQFYTYFFLAPAHLPAMPLAQDRTTTDELLNKLFPELIGTENASHTCAYRDLLGKFVIQDLQRQSMDRLEGLPLYC